MASDTAIIQAAFNKVSELERYFGDSIPARAIVEPFDVGGELMQLSNQAQGIFKPRLLSAGVMSIKTTISRDGSPNIYNDQLMDDGFYQYSLQRGDPRGASNKYLWDSLKIGVRVNFLITGSHAMRKLTK